MQRFYHRPGAGIVVWRQGAIATTASTVAPTTLHRMVYSRGRRVRILSTQQSVASSGATAYPLGVSASAVIGTPTATGQGVALPAGVTATGEVGTPIASGSTSIAGIGYPTGVAASASVGVPIALGQNGAGVAAPAGVAAFAIVGTPTATGAAIVLPAGVAATASVGTPVAVSGNLPVYANAPSGGGYMGTCAGTYRPRQINTVR